MHIPVPQMTGLRICIGTLLAIALNWKLPKWPSVVQQRDILWSTCAIHTAPMLVHTTIITQSPSAASPLVSCLIFAPCGSSSNSRVIFLKHKSIISHSPA